MPNTSSAHKQSLIVRNLYRALKRVSKTFTESPTRTCLALHRTGLPHHNNPYRQLVHEVLQGRMYQFPNTYTNTMDPGLLERVIHREFRKKTLADVSVGFRALRELSSKRDFIRSLDIAEENDTSDGDLGEPRILGVNTTDHLRPGTFLVAHPLLSGYFARSVILILDTSSSSTASYGAYGLIVNRPCRREDDDKHLTLAETIRPLPTIVDKVFGNRPVREGGPVHVAVQCLYATAANSEQLSQPPPLGGIRLPTKGLSSLHKRKTVYYKGDMLQVASAATPPDHHHVFVGASCWAVGQLEEEIAQGCWLTCQAPLTLAFADEQQRYSKSLWEGLMDADGYSEMGWQSRYFVPEDCAPCDLAK